MTSSTSTFLSALTAGVLLGILFAPLKGRELRDILFSSEDSKDWGDRETFSLLELVSKDSVSFQTLKEKIARDN